MKAVVLYTPQNGWNELFKSSALRDTVDWVAQRYHVPLPTLLMHDNVMTCAAHPGVNHNGNTWKDCKFVHSTGTFNTDSGGTIHLSSARLSIVAIFHEFHHWMDYRNNPRAHASLPINVDLSHPYEQMTEAAAQEDMRAWMAQR